MSDQPSKSSKELTALRDEFAASAKKTLAGFDKMIWEAQVAEALQEKNAVLAQFVPGSDTAALAGHDVVFLINKSKGMGGGMESALGVAVDTMYQVSYATKSIEGFTLAAKLWGGAGGTNGIFLGSYDIVKKAGDATDADSKDFLPVAKEILAANTPDKVSDRQTHYIVICDGNISGSLELSSSILGAVAGFNPKATFDFVVCGAEGGNVDKLTWAAAQGPRLTRAGGYAELPAVIMNVLKARLTEGASLKPKAAPAAPPVDVPKP